MHRVKADKFSVTLGAAALAIAGVLATDGGRAAAQTYHHLNAEPQIEMYFYPASSANGLGSVRDGASTFGNYGLPNSEGELEFYEGDGMELPARRGSIIVVTDSSADVPAGLAPYRYRVDALKMSMTFNSSNLGTGIVYDNTAEDSAAATTAGGDDEGKPVEMWGIGLGGQYQTFGFQGETGAQYFKEGSRRWPIASGVFTGPYEIFPVDAAGNDVENSIMGGYSATAPNHHTAQFSPNPMAIGRVFDGQGVELTAGSEVAPQSEYDFTPRIDDAGVLAYVQNSLAAGHLGFFVSSLHLPFGHGGAVPYPRWHLDVDPQSTTPADAGPSFDLSVTILPPLVGDYNHDAVVDGDDFLTWQRTVGQTGLTPGSGADGDLSGTIDAGDLTAWSEHLGDVFAPAVPAALPVPEPGVGALLAWGLLPAATWGRRRVTATRHR